MILSILRRYFDNFMDTHRWGKTQTATLEYIVLVKICGPGRVALACWRFASAFTCAAWSRGALKASACFFCIWLCKPYNAQSASTGQIYQHQQTGMDKASRYSFLWSPVFPSNGVFKANDDRQMQFSFQPRQPCTLINFEEKMESHFYWLQFHPVQGKFPSILYFK